MKVLKVLLAEPPKKEIKYDLSYPNLGILYLMGAIKNKFGDRVDVKYLEGHYNLVEHIQQIRDFNPDIYGFSFVYLIRDLAYKTLNEVKLNFPEMFIMAGGAHVTSAPEDALTKTRIDLCCLGEGEDFIVDFIENYLRDGKDIDLSSIKGITFKKDGRVVRTAKRPIIKDINTIPFPYWKAIDFSKYPGMHIRMANPQSYLLVSRGCPFDCNFCSNPIWKLNKPWVRARKAENIAEEIRILYDHGVREIYLSADEFNLNEKWTLSVCDAIEALGLRDLWLQCNARVDKVSPAMAEAFRRINMWLIHIGIESGSQKTIDGIGKKIKIEQINNACKIFKEAGLKVFGYVMLYHAWEKDGELQWETPIDVENTRKYCKFLLKNKLMDYMSWQVATPMPGSRLWETAKKYNLISNVAINNFRSQNLNLPNISDKDIKRSVRRGLIMKNYYLAKNGHMSLKHIDKVWGTLKYILGFEKKMAA